MIPDFVWLIVSCIFGGLLLLRFQVTFDANEWLRDRRKHQIESLKALCPHTRLEAKANGEVEVTSYFTSTPGCLELVCSRCKFTTIDPRVPSDLARIWVTNPAEYARREKMFLRQFRRLASG